MCGIIGYLGNQNALPILFDSLYRMEYRGYDSAGIAFFNQKNQIEIFKDKGKIKDIRKNISSNLTSHVGIGHTRWATHGKVNQTNAHPIFSQEKQIAVVHNGIIENYLEIRKDLIQKGYTFNTETDTESLAQLIDYHYRKEKSLKIAFEKSLHQIQGSLGILVLASGEPNKILAYRSGSPLILGIKDKNIFIASDVHAILPYTNKIIYLEDQEMVLISNQKFSIWNKDNHIIYKKIIKVNINKEAISKKGYSTFMLKEINEQAESFNNCIRGRLNLKEGNSIIAGIRNLKNYHPFNRIIILGMGSSYYSGMIGKYLIEEFANIPTSIEYSAEFKYRKPVINQQTLIIVISQSGETADTLEALKKAKLKGATTFSICNTIQSNISRESHEGMFLYAGPEISVASTKCFSSQILALNLIAIALGRNNNLSFEEGKTMIDEILKFPTIIKKFLQDIPEPIYNLSLKICNFKKIFFLGRNYHYPIALEGALKLKEISYINAQGYQAAEMKHGPLALIDEDTLCIFLNFEEHTYKKIHSNIAEICSRGGKIVLITNEEQDQVTEYKDNIIQIPKVPYYLSPILAIIPLQLLAYYIAQEKNFDVDKPRNLAKSVTVE